MCGGRMMEEEPEEMLRCEKMKGSMCNLERARARKSGQVKCGAEEVCVKGSGCLEEGRKEEADEKEDEKREDDGLW